MIDEANIFANDLADGNVFYTRAKDLIDKLKYTFLHGKIHGETCYFDWLKPIFTLRKGFLYCFTGWPSAGKSEFLTQLSVLQAHFKQRKTAFYSPESYPIDEFVDTFIHCYLGKSTDRKYPNVCTMQQYESAIEWANEYFFYCDWDDSPTAERLVKSFEFLHKHHGVEIFVVDPFNSLVTESEEKNIAVALKNNLTRFKRFATQKNVMVWLVEHPRTPTDPKEYLNIPGPRQLFGGTMWWNKVDVLASVHRPNANDPDDRLVTFKTWKIKRHELNGRPGEQSLYFNIRTKRYYETNFCLDHPMNEDLIDRMYREKETQPF